MGSQLTRADGRKYVIAVADHSGLTLVFEATSVDAFKPAMVAALTAAFEEDLSIPVSALPDEITDIESAAFARLRDRVVLYELDFIESLCGIDCPDFSRDLRRAQLSLNDFPRQRQTPCEPRIAAPLLFGIRSGSPTLQ